jgi:hypothetical protein
LSRKVLLHVGTPKTGTSYLQDVLFRNREVLAAAGIAYPAARHDSHFLAALDLMQLPWGGLQSEAIGAWDELAREVREHDGTAIISHEILATASRAQIGRALESLGHGTGTEVHLVLSVRDLVRQIPAEWQGERQAPRASALRRLPRPDHRPRARFADRRVVLGCPGDPGHPRSLGTGSPAVAGPRGDRAAAGGAPELLWKRFSQAFGLDGIDLDLEGERHNPSLGVPETTLLRRINRKANAELAPADYRPLVRELLAHQTLSRRTRSPRLALPPDLHPWVQELSASWIAEIEARGYDVSATSVTSSGHRRWSSTPTRTIPASGRSPRCRRSGHRSAARQRPGCGTRRPGCTRAGRRAGALERAYATPSYRLRRRIVVRLERSRARAGLLGVYRPGAGQELAVGVAADPPRAVGVRAEPDEAAGDGIFGDGRAAACRDPVVSSAATSRR